MDKQKRKSDRERLAKLEFERSMIQIELESYDDTTTVFPGSNLTREFVEYNKKLNDNSKAFMLLKLSRFNIEIEYIKNMFDTC